MVTMRLSRMRYALALDTFMRSLDIIGRAMTHYRLEVDQPDVIIRPRVTEIDTLDRVDVHTVVHKGEEAVEEVLPALRNMSTWRRRFRRVRGIQA